MTFYVNGAHMGINIPDSRI